MIRIFPHILYLITVLLIIILIIKQPATPLKYIQRPDTKNSTPQKIILPVFKDETINQGIFKPHMQSSDTLSGIHESFGAGACILDYNNDGWMDLFLINGSGQRRYFGEKEWWQSSSPFTLYKNTGMNSFEDVTDTALGKRIKGWGMGCAAADLDNDGDQDLVISNYGANILLENNADGTFKDSTIHSNIKGDSWSTSILTADFNNDGLLDIYILNFIHYEQGLKTYEASSGYTAGKNKQFNASLFDSSPNQLYINKGNLVFQNQTHTAELEDASGKGISAEAMDVNNDGYADIFISNGQGGENKLFINNGAHNGNLSFTDASENFNIASVQHTTGVKSADINNDSSLDLLIGTDNKNSKLLYEKVNNSLLVDTAKKSGIDKIETSGAMTWGVALSDFNNDGNIDIFFANGFTNPDLLSTRKAQGQPNTLLINTLTDFHSCDFNCYLENNNDDRESSRSVIPADFDNDGDTDLYISQNNSLGQLLINTTEKEKWLGVKLVGIESNKDALGSIVTLRTKNKTYVKKISNTGFLSSHDKRISFHIGNNLAESLTIKWPSGNTSNFSQLPGNRYITLHEGNKSYLPYNSITPKQTKSRIIFSKRIHKIEAIKWLASTKRKEEANVEVNLILSNKPTNQELIRLVEISDLLDPKIALKINLLGIKSDNINLRIKSLKNLKNAEEEISARFLLRLFSDPSPQVKCEIARTYEHFFREEEAMIHSKPLAIPELIHALSDSNDDVKMCAINALAESENHRGVQPLLQLILSTDKHSNVRTRAIVALGRLREKKAVELLINILHNPKEPSNSRYTAMSSLKRLNAIDENTFIKENLTAYYNKGNVLDFLQLLLDLSKDSEHNVIISPKSIKTNLQSFAQEKKQNLKINETILIEKIITASQHINIIKNQKNHSSKPHKKTLLPQKIKEMQKILSDVSGNIEARVDTLNDKRITRLFSSKRIIKKISTNKNDPLQNEAIVFLVENPGSDKELVEYKKQILDNNYDEEYRFFIAEGLFKKDPDYIINKVLIKK